MKADKGFLGALGSLAGFPAVKRKQEIMRAQSLATTRILASPDK